MESKNPSALPQLLEILSEIPDSTARVDTLSEMVFARLREEGYHNDDKDAAFKNALDIGCDLGVISVKNGVVKMAFRFGTSENKGTSDEQTKSAQDDKVTKVSKSKNSDHVSSANKKRLAHARNHFHGIQKPKTVRALNSSTKMKSCASTTRYFKECCRSITDLFENSRQQNDPVWTTAELMFKRNCHCETPKGPIESRDYCRQVTSDGTILALPETPEFSPKFPGVSTPSPDFNEKRDYEGNTRK